MFRLASLVRRVPVVRPVTQSVAPLALLRNFVNSAKPRAASHAVTRLSSSRAVTRPSQKRALASNAQSKSKPKTTTSRQLRIKPKKVVARVVKPKSQLKKLRDTAQARLRTERLRLQRLKKAAQKERAQEVDRTRRLVARQRIAAQKERAQEVDRARNLAAKQRIARERAHEREKEARRIAKDRLKIQKVREHRDHVADVQKQHKNFAKSVDSQRPTTPGRSFSQYVKSCFEKLDQSGTKIPRQELPAYLKELATQWKDLSQEQKQPFIDQFQQGMEKYHQEMMSFYKTFPPPPAKPTTSYSIFVKQCLSGTAKPVTEAMADVAQQWKNLPDSQKEQIKAQAKESSAKYHQDIEAYKAKHPQLFNYYKTHKH